MRITSSTVMGVVSSTAAFDGCIPACTCDVNRARFVASLNVFLDSCYEDFSNMQELSECIHVKASISIITQLDAIHSITPTIEFVGMHMIITYQYIADTVLLLVLLHGISGKPL